MTKITQLSIDGQEISVTNYQRETHLNPSQREWWMGEKGTRFIIEYKEDEWIDCAVEFEVTPAYGALVETAIRERKPIGVSDSSGKLVLFPYTSGGKFPYDEWGERPFNHKFWLSWNEPKAE